MIFTRFAHRDIGRITAVAEFGFVRPWGEPAWWRWGAAMLVIWFFLTYLTFGTDIRRITGSESARVAMLEQGLSTAFKVP